VSRLGDLAIWVGGGALLAATVTDTLAVIGRLIDIPVLGSIEIVQAAVLVAGSIALVAATARDRHARVRLIVDRLGAGSRQVADRMSLLFTALFFVGLLAGSGWLAVDLWSGHEVSELVHVPWRWLRLFANLSLVTAILILIRHARGKVPE
jgi:TRAP-type C4-dicarboxylate transport system permease small subunit